MDWLSLIALTVANTFWLFYLAGDIPGTVGHRQREERHKASVSVLDSSENRE